jgi:fumarylpyruvate hydrolase
MTNDYQHEIELVVAIETGGSNITVEESLGHIFGYAIGLDMTRRDLQMVARDMGRPWEFGKSFSPSTPIGPIYTVDKVGHFYEGVLSLEVNGTTRQASNLSELIWSVQEIIANLSMHDPLRAGDLIMTGTPAGVKAVVKGDVMTGKIAGLGEITIKVN